jgi:hypothetical protein
MLLAVILSTSLQAYNPALTAAFFRSPSSVFPSGEANSLELRKSLERTEPDARILLVLKGSQKWISDFGFATDITVSKKVQFKGPGNFAEVVASQGASAKIKDSSGIRWVSISELASDPTDPGVAVALVNTGIRKAPDWNSTVLSVVAPGTRLEILDYQEEWLHVQWGPLRGYIDYGRVLLKADFAAFVLSAKNEWLPVSHRESGKWILRNQSTLKLSPQLRVLTRPDLAIAIENILEINAKIKSHFIFARNASLSWNVSRYKNHDLVYWKEPPQPSVHVLTTEQILKMEIHSVAFHPFDSKQALIAASGIYYTYDAITWKKINKFTHQNLPVFISDTGDWIVGNFKAEKNTLDFKHYFKIESLTNQIQKQNNASVKFLKIEKIESSNKNSLKLTIDTGTKKFLATGSWLQDHIHSWTLQ